MHVVKNYVELALPKYPNKKFLKLLFLRNFLPLKSLRSSGVHDRQLLTGAGAAGSTAPHNKYYGKAWPRSRSQVERHVHNHPPICRKESPDQSTFRSTSLESEVDREHSEMVVNSHAHKHERKHHHRHHHHHKHRSHTENDRNSRSRY